MKHKRLYPAIVLVMVVATVLIVFGVDRQKAIHQAIVACEEIYGLRLLETPTATQTTVTTYGRTISPKQNRELWWPTDAGRLVWVVKMKGNWMSFPIQGGPLPAEGEVNTEPVMVHDDCTIVIAAITGETKTEPIE